MKNLLILIGILTINISSYAQATFTQLNELPHDASFFNESRSVNIGKYVYVFGCDNNLYSYSPELDSWKIVTSYPGVHRQGVYLLAIDSSIYVLGGTPYDEKYAGERNLNYKYDLKNGTWEQKSNIPFFLVTQNSMASFTYNNKGYVLCHESKEFYKYEASTDHWHPLASFPPTTMSGTQKPYFLHGSKFYITHGNTSFAVDQTWMYDIETNIWTQKSNAPSKFGVDAFFTLGDNGYVVFGNKKGIATDDFYSYNFASDKWTTLTKAPFRADSPMSFSFDSVAYVSGGVFGDKGTFSFWKIDLDKTKTAIENKSILGFEILLYPCPVSTKLNLEFHSNKSEMLTVKILASNGEVLFQKSTLSNIGNNLIPISMLDFTQGVYLVLIENSEGQKIVKKFLKD